MKVSLIIPAYNEENIIVKSIGTLKDYCDSLACDYEIVIVNDGSTDSTGELIRERLAGDKIIDAGYADNRGKGGALKAGVLASSGDIIVTTDCDLAYGCDVIKMALEVMESEQCDLLIGSRALAKDGFAGYPIIRKLASKLYFRLLSVYAGLSVSDSQCGFKCYTRKAAKVLFGQMKTYGFAFDLEILLRAKNHGYKLSQIPVTIKNHGSSKINILKDSVRMLSDVAKIKKICADKAAATAKGDCL